MKGQLPKAYLRIDPNIDQTHPDCGAMLRLLCAGARQPVRGRFKTWAVLVNAIGRAKAIKHRDAWRDVHQDGDAWVIDGWSVWQEGDLTVGERMRLYRERKRHAAVTPAVTVTASPSETARQQGSKALETESSSVSSFALSEEIRSAPGNMSEEQRTEYARAVWSALIQRRGSEFPLMSSAEFDMVASWMSRGVRLSTVLRGIRDCSPGAMLPSLRYCEGAVEEAIRFWRQAMGA